MQKKENEIKREEVKTQEKNCFISRIVTEYFCPICGHKVVETNKHCWNCGYCISCN